MNKKNALKAVLILVVIIVILLLFHLVGNNLINMIKSHMGV